MSNFNTPGVESVPIAKISIVKKPIVNKPIVNKPIVNKPIVKVSSVKVPSVKVPSVKVPSVKKTIVKKATSGTSDPSNRREVTEPLKDWKIYIIYHTGCGATYAGVSPDPVRRLRMHNGEICGGAKYTTSKGPGWVHICLVSGFPTKQNSMQFEWAIKHVAPRNVGGLESRLRKLGILFRKEQWTSKSPLADSVPLEIEWIGVVPPCGVGGGGVALGTPCGVGVGGAGIDVDTTNFKVFGVERSVVGALPDYVREIVIK